MTPAPRHRITVKKLRVYDPDRPERWGWLCSDTDGCIHAQGPAVDQPGAITAGEAHLAGAHVPARPPMPSPTRWRAAWAKRAR